MPIGSWLFFSTVAESIPVDRKSRWVSTHPPQRSYPMPVVSRHFCFWWSGKRTSALDLRLSVGLELPLLIEVAGLDDFFLWRF